MLYTYLKEHYDDGEPIFVEDLNLENINRPNLIQQLKTLADNGRLVRYEKGIYYIPRQTRFRSSGCPTPETLAKYKYLSRNGKVSGYYSGSTFANLIGLSLQVPMKKEIVSNNSAAIVREATIGKQTFIIRRARVPVSAENVHVLQLLDLLKDLDAYLDGSYEDARKKIKAYILANHITREGVDLYIRQYPDSTFRYYYEMRLDDVLA